MAEGVRINRTGAEKILNSKTIFNRSGIPKIVCSEFKEVQNLGDREEMPTEPELIEEESPEVILTGEALAKSERRKKKKEASRDLLNWGGGGN